MERVVSNTCIAPISIPIECLRLQDEQKRQVIQEQKHVDKARAGVAGRRRDKTQGDARKPPSRHQAGAYPQVPASQASTEFQGRCQGQWRRVSCGLRLSESQSRPVRGRLLLACMSRALDAVEDPPRLLEGEGASQSAARPKGNESVRGGWMGRHPDLGAQHASCA